tara:strand:+ start:733 stop:1095 length:363 start_codon:yes stop_codon:yes gene_type:complete
MQKKILVVEDEVDVLKVVGFVLKKKGYSVISALDGEKGLELVKEERPDLILLDFYLPVMDGLALSKKLKADSELSKIPILLLTASADNITQKAKECQANDYLLKPFDYTVLLQKVKNLIG